LATTILGVARQDQCGRAGYIGTPADDGNEVVVGEDPSGVADDVLIDNRFAGSVRPELREDRSAPEVLVTSMRSGDEMDSPSIGLTSVRPSDFAPITTQWSASSRRTKTVVVS
jgi:hypothetical protein